MAIGIPSEIAPFLVVCGIPYPEIDEDDVRALARHVRAFAEQVRDTHDSATGVIDQMGAFYSGATYRQLVATWSSMSADHMESLDRACKLADRALDVAATVITEVKAAVLAALAALATAHATITVTPPLARSAPLIVAAARGLCAEMSRQLVRYIVAEVVGKAIEPLERAVDDMVRGIVDDITRDPLDLPLPGGSPATRIDPDAIQHFARVLDDHADDIMRHAAVFAANVSTLDFATSMPLGYGAEHIAQPEAHVGLPAPVAVTALGGDGTGGARIPAGTGAPVRHGDRSALPAETEGLSSGVAATPWGRAGQPYGTPDPVPLRPGRPATAAPKARRPAVTPWTKTRRSRDVPAVVHAPGTRPSLRVAREKRADANSAGLADVNSVRSRVMTPASERAGAPPERG
ncbi:hypothetical protein AB0346_14490 [Nocardia beijingensis]|uniref:WXG100-like domain-containing protein n=1 Tax=Nocardia beijingensis TaxID=95162 RepID=UPI00345034FF